MMWVCAIDLDNSITQFRNVSTETSCCVIEYISRLRTHFGIDNLMIYCALWDSGTRMYIPNDSMITIQPLERPNVILSNKKTVSIECPVLFYSSYQHKFTFPHPDDFFQVASNVLCDTNPVINPLLLSIKPSFFDDNPNKTTQLSTTLQLSEKPTIDPPPVITINCSSDTMTVFENPSTHSCANLFENVPTKPLMSPPSETSKPDFSKLDLRFF